jgi:pimeloyl-ACP methyl ester carboxylesterase
LAGATLRIGAARAAHGTELACGSGLLGRSEPTRPQEERRMNRATDRLADRIAAPQRAPRGSPALRTLRTVALVAGAALVARTAWQTRRELAAWRVADARLRSDWSSVDAPAALGRLRIHARIGGPARSSLPPVVLVHGLGMSSAYLVPLAARIGRHADVYVPDLPGHGNSDRDERPLTVPEHAEALGAWLESRRLRGALLVGHSMGTQVVTELAARRPELACGVILIAPTSDPTVARPTQMLWRNVRSMLAERPSFGLWAMKDMRRAGARVLATEFRETLQHRIERVLPDVRVPVRVLRGEHDALVPQRWAAAVARVANSPAPTAIPGWGHGVPYDDPDAIVKAIFTLARAVRAQSGRTAGASNRPVGTVRASADAAGAAR